MKVYRTYVVQSEDAVSWAIVNNLGLPLTVSKALCCVKAACCIFRLKILSTLEGNDSWHEAGIVTRFFALYVPADLLQEPSSVHN